MGFIVSYFQKKSLKIRIESVSVKFVLSSLYINFIRYH